MVLEITEGNFDEIMKEPLVLLDFWAEWCAPCRMLSPTIEGISKEYDGKLVVGKVDVDRCHEIAVRFGIMGIPTLMLFRNGKLADKKVGLVPREEIKTMIDRWLG